MFLGKFRLSKYFDPLELSEEGGGGMGQNMGKTLISDGKLNIIRNNWTWLEFLKLSNYF